MNVAALRRHPVKSLLGETVAEATVDSRGLAGDRRFAFVDAETGRVASAKQPRLWRSLLTARAELIDGGVRVTLPDESTVDGPSAKLDVAISALTGRAVALAETPPEDRSLERAVPEDVLRDGVEAAVDFTVGELGGAAPGTFFDFAPVHIVTTATLARIAELSPRGTVEALRYRPNIIVEVPGSEGFVENDWIGRVLRVGGAALRILVPTPRCAIPTLAHGELAIDRDALRIPARHNRVEVAALGALPCVGVYATVESPGTLHKGAPVRLAG